MYVGSRMFALLSSRKKKHISIGLSPSLQPSSHIHLQRTHARSCPPAATAIRNDKQLATHCGRLLCMCASMYVCTLIISCKSEVLPFAATAIITKAFTNTAIQCCKVLASNRRRISNKRSRVLQISSVGMFARRKNSIACKRPGQVLFVRSSCNREDKL